MNAKTIPAALLLFTGILCNAQTNENAPDNRPKLTLEQAELIIPRPQLKPVKSLVPGQANAIDTLDTQDPLIKLILYADNTWRYVKDGDRMMNDEWFKKNWNDSAMDPFGVEYSTLPERVTLWLVDENSDFCCPYQTRVFSKFGIRKGRRHQGCDLPLTKGDPVFAAFDGKVRISNYTSGYGNLVVIRHANGLETAYGHLSERKVKVGDWVTAGDIIGLGGSTGRSTGPHLHFETRYQGYAFDPEWICDFEKGTLRSGVFTLKKKYLNAASTYVPESEEEEEAILLAEEEERAAAQKKAAEKAAIQYHTIKRGDTLGALAAKYHTTVRQLCAWNGIKETTLLQLGKKLRVH